MITEMRSVNGQSLPDGCCVCVDNVVDTFVIQIRSGSGLSPEQVKNLLQTKWEVTQIKANQRTNFVHAGGAITAMRR